MSRYLPLVTSVCQLAIALAVRAQEAPAPPGGAAPPVVGTTPSVAPTTGPAATESAAAAATPDAAAAKPVATASSPRADHAAPAARASAASTGALQLETTQITGNRELPKVMVIVPWKNAEPAALAGRPINSLVEEVLTPIDRDVMRRTLDYYKLLADAPADASGKSAQAAQTNTTEQ